MFVPFSSLPSSSRVWIFQAPRPMEADELAVASARLRDLTENWMVHGAPVNTSFEIRYNQFIVLAADEHAENISGCSIDSALRGVKALGQELGLDLFDRDKVAFKTGDEIILYSLRELKEKFTEGTLNSDALTFDNLVGTKAAFDREWVKACGNTWLKRYIPGDLVKVK